MTTTFELTSSIESYHAFGISRVADPNSVYNSLSRVQSVRAASVAQAALPQLDSADISGASTLVAAALTGSDLRTDRIATLRESIIAGTYRVSAAAVADTLFNSTLANS